MKPVSHEVRVHISDVTMDKVIREMAPSARNQVWNQTWIREESWRHLATLIYTYMPREESK